jgi:hypothetical protein
MNVVPRISSGVGPEGCEGSGGTVHALSAQSAVAAATRRACIVMIDGAGEITRMARN